MKARQQEGIEGKVPNGKKSAESARAKMIAGEEREECLCLRYCGIFDKEVGRYVYVTPVVQQTKRIGRIVAARSDLSLCSMVL